MPNGDTETAVVINLLGSFERTGRTNQNHVWKEHAPDELLAIIREMGVVGQGNDAGNRRMDGTSIRGRTGNTLIFMDNVAFCKQRESRPTEVLPEQNNGRIGQCGIADRRIQSLFFFVPRNDSTMKKGFLADHAAIFLLPDGTRRVP